MKADELKIDRYYFRGGNYPECVIKMTREELADVLKIGGEYNYDGIPLTEDWLVKLGFEKKPQVMWRGNGYDWQPDYPRTYHQDFFNGKFIYRFTEWHWDDKGEIKIDKSTEGLCNDNWYDKIQEGTLNSIGCKHVHQLQNLYFALTGEELTIK